MRISDWSSDVCSSDLPVLSPVVLLFCIFPSSNEPIKRRRFNKDQALVTHRDRSELHRRIGRARRSHRLHDRLDMADRQGNTAIPVHRPCAVERRSEEHTSELQSLMRISYAVFCLKKKNTQ